MPKGQRKKRPVEGDQFGDFPKKWAKYLEGEDEFISKAQQSSSEELDKMVVQYNESISALESDRDADTDLASLKEQVKETEMPYSVGIKVNQAKIRYALSIKKSLGAPVSE